MLPCPVPLPGENREIAINTATLATAVAISATAVAVPLAWLTTRTNLPGVRWWRVAAGLPLVIPSYVGALTMIAALGPKGLLQGWLEGPMGVDRLPPIYGFFGSWLTLTLFTYPYVYLAFRQRFGGSILHSKRRPEHWDSARLRRLSDPCCLSCVRPSHLAHSSPPFTPYPILGWCR